MKKTMGFNKRFVDKEIIEYYLKQNKSFSILFKADAFIFTDNLSSKVHDWYCEGNSDEEIRKKWFKLLNKNIKID